MKDKRFNMVWLPEDEPRPEVLKTGFRSRKRMFTIFFNSQGPVVVDIMPDKATITATYSTTSVLPKNLRHIQSTARTRRRSQIQLHYDNTAPHKARITQTYLGDNGIRLMEHPQYSPDLAPCDFWLFLKIKSAPAGKPFSRIQDLAKAVHSEMRAIPASEYRECFQKWRMRMQRRIEVEGSYFEGMYLYSLKLQVKRPRTQQRTQHQRASSNITHHFQQQPTLITRRYPSRPSPNIN